jgi:cytochrome b
MVTPAAMPQGSLHESTRPVRVWDLPTRLFHWSLALAVFTALATAWVGGGAMIWHTRVGMLILALLVFRLAWGLLGGRWSRFASFAYGPRTVLRYLRGQARDDEHLDVGHNPIGSFSVFMVLGVLLAQVATGLVADDEIATTGPLNRLVTKAQGLAATQWHHGPGQWLILGLVGLHIAAIAFYFVAKSRNLVLPMLVGDKALPAGTPASRDTSGTRLLALGLAAASGVLAIGLYRQGG